MTLSALAHKYMHTVRRGGAKYFGPDFPNKASLAVDQHALGRDCCRRRRGWMCRPEGAHRHSPLAVPSP